MSLERHRLTVPGGILTPLELRNLAWNLSGQKVAAVGLSARQELWWDRPEIVPAVAAEPGWLITSSVWLSELIPSTPWVSTGLIIDLLRQIGRLPGSGVIELLDSLHAPHHPWYGRWRFLAGELPHSWGLEVREAGRSWRWPTRIDTSEIATLCAELAADGSAEATLARLWPDLAPQAIPVVAAPGFAALEGWFALPGKVFGLALHRIDHRFPVPFLLAAAELAAKQGLARFFLSPWRTLVVKGIGEAQKNAWTDLIRRHGLRTRHADSAWALFAASDADPTIRAKRRLAQAWENRNERVEDRRQVLVDADLSAEEFWADAVLRPEGEQFRLVGHPITEDDDGLRTAESLGTLNTTHDADTNQPLPEVPEAVKPQTPVWRCRHCLTVYDPKVGEPERGIPSGTGWEVLPLTWTCSCCDAEKADFTSAFRPVLAADGSR